MMLQPGLLLLFLLLLLGHQRIQCQQCWLLPCCAALRVASHGRLHGLPAHLRGK
jgi:hypothetical protein